MKIGLISDTHIWIHPRLFELFEGCDEVWHAGYAGFHKYMTAIRFHIDGKRIYNLDLIELGERSKAIT